jgi:trans-aconitate methyltransferase
MNVFDAYVDDYDAACDRGLSLSGETRDYFARQRIVRTRNLCRNRTIRGVLDFGCGVGSSTPCFVETFPGAEILGVDASSEAVRAAEQRFGSEHVRFTTMLTRERRSVDLAYSNGTFHHIEPGDRERFVREIFGCLKPGAVFALWENNPWNPGTRLVMKRIPFDRDAKMLSCLQAQTLLRRCGLRVLSCSFHFYFPAWLRRLRSLEPRLERVPFGAQYCVLAEKPHAP